MNFNPELPKMAKLTSLKKIASGADSDVFLTSTGEILKHYPTWQSDPSQVALYQEVTNTAAENLKLIPVSSVLNIGNRTLPCAFEVNPILERTLDHEGIPIARSAFIAGPRFDQVQNGNQKFDSELAGLPSDERTFFEESYRAINDLELMSERMGYCQFNDPAFLDKLTVKLNLVLAVTGIRLVPLNMKLRVNPCLNQARMIITDLCPGLASLKRT